MTEPHAMHIQQVLSNHAGMAKAMFFLWIGSVFALYLYYVLAWLPGLGFATFAVLFVGLLTGVWYVIGALLGGLIWALLLPAHFGVRALSKWAREVLDEAAAQVRHRGTQRPEDEVVDVGEIEEEVDTIIYAQTSQFTGTSERSGLMPNLTGKGLRYVVVSAAGSSGTFAGGTFQKRAVGAADQLAMGAIRRVLWGFTGIFLLVATAWLGLPLLLTWGLAAALGLSA